MLCSTAICPSVFRNGACTDQEFVSSYSCVMVFTVAGQPLSNCPMRIEFYVQHWTGGHCHDDATRPVAYWPDGHGGFDPLASLDRTTDANGVVTFSFIAPEVASGLNLVPYSLDSARPSIRSATRRSGSASECRIWCPLPRPPGRLSTFSAARHIVPPDTLPTSGRFLR